MIGETNLKRNITKMAAGLSWPLEMQVPGSGILIPRVQHSFFSFPEMGRFLDFCPTPGAEALLSVSILNPLKSRV